MIRRLELVLSAAVTYASSRAFRWLIVLLGLIAAASLVYRSVWLPLQQALPLPPGVAPTNPELDTTVLKDINSQRALRVQRARQNFARYSNVFEPSPPAE